MEKSNLCEICRRSAGIISNKLTILVSVDPPLGPKLFPVIAPELWAAVNGVWAQKDPGPLGNVFPSYHAVPNSFTYSHGDSRIQTKDFLTHPVEERKSLEVAPGDRMVAGWDALTDLGTKALLDIRIKGEKIAGPGEGTRGGFVLQTMLVSRGIVLKIGADIPQQLRRSAFGRSTRRL